eukprot:scaffold138703_cov15-Prasinocladus_malaysianus.AAC.1
MGSSLSICMYVPRAGAAGHDNGAPVGRRRDNVTPSITSVPYLIIIGMATVALVLTSTILFAALVVFRTHQATDNLQ